MKKVLTLVVLVVLFVSCSQNDVAISDQYTYTGRGGMKCEVDGILLAPSTALLYPNSNVTATLSPNGITSMVLTYTNGSVNNGLGPQGIAIVVKNANPTPNLTGTVFQLTEQLVQGDFGSFGNYNQNGIDFTTNQNVTGELKVLFHDPERRIIGGTFWFDAVSTDGGMRQIRNGQFDMTIN